MGMKPAVFLFAVASCLAGSLAAPGHSYYYSHHGHHPHMMRAKAAPVPVPARAAPALGDVVDVAVGAGSFTTLVKIVSDLGLVQTLKDAEALTVFAPSDEAFAKLPEGTLESLTPDQAKEIVLRHVLASNGVIHVIDNVILPAPAAKAAPELGDVVDV